jgi:hypothetical protein
MRIWHLESHSFIQGKIKEAQKINAWCDKMKQLDHRFMIMVDDSDEDEISYTIVVSGTTQKERSELASRAKNYEVVKGTR